MVLFYDLGISSFVVAPLNLGVISQISLTRGDSSSINIKFCRDGSVVELGTGAVGIFDIKLPTQFSGETPLVSATSWTKSGSGSSAVYSFSPNLNTIPLNKSLIQGAITGTVADQAARFALVSLTNGQIYYQQDTGISWTIVNVYSSSMSAGWILSAQFSSIDLLAEIQITDGDSISTLSRLSVTLLNDLIKGTEGTPAAIPDLKASQDEAEAGTDNSKWMTPLRVAQEIVAKSISEAPSDGQTYGRSSGAWHVINPQNVTLPTITGVASEGNTLNDVNTDTWTGAPTSFLLQWQRGSGSSWTNISGATASTYTLVLADVGYQIRMIKSALNSVGQSLPFSEATPTAVVTALTIPTGALAEWLMNGSGADTSGNGHDLVMTGTVPFVSGVNGQAAQFDGSGSNLLATSGSTFGGLTTFSVSLWFNQTSQVGLYDGPLSVNGPSAGLDIIISGGLSVYSEASGVNIGPISPTISTGTWYHIVITMDGTTEIIYINGASAGSAGNSADILGDILFGLDVAGGTSGYFQGLVQTARVYDRALSSGEVSALWNGGTPV